MPIKQLGYMIDCSRGQVPRISSLKKLVDILSAFKYTYLMLYTEDTYEMEGHPYFGHMRGRYSKEELHELDEYASSKGIELRGCIQTLAHMERIKRHGPYKHLYDMDNIFLVGDENVYNFIDEMFKNMSNLIKSRTIHIGMDEAWNIGRGIYLDIHGHTKTKDIMDYHLKRVSDIAKKYGYKCYIWGDMLANAYFQDPHNYNLELPSNITPFIWRYSPVGKKETDKEISLYKNLAKGNIAYAGGVDKWRGFVPHNQYAFESLKEQIEGCNKHGIDNFLVTAWADCGADASMFSSLPGIFYASVIARGLDIKDVIDEFNKVIGMEFKDFLHIDDLDRCKDKKSIYKGIVNDLSFNHLYNDPLQELYPEIEKEEYPKIYTKIAKRLQKLTKNEEFGYIFDSLYHLARVLTYKCNLAHNIDYAYKNKLDLTPVINQAKRVIKELKAFIKVYENQWLKECKGMGYEKQIIRLGGLKERLRFTVDILTKYQNKQIDSIDELEEIHIISNMNGHPVDPDKDVICDYRVVVSGGSLIEL